MGVPKFFRWLGERYPTILQLVEEDTIPEFDNLYLDMNGIVHHCTHSNEGDGNLGLTENEMFYDIFKYIEKIFYKIKPKNVFYLAVDGVAPRAKMNEQRARRFRKVKEVREFREKEKRKGREIVANDTEFDSNCITPGTEFMRRLSEHLGYFIRKKITEDLGWRNVEVIFSGSDVPGEGEHKIMEFIRYQKSKEEHPSNTRHCLYGLDADLMILGLTLHEPHMSLLREEVRFTRSRASDKNKKEAEKFYLLHLSLVREYLEYEFEVLKEVEYQKGDVGYDIERVIDDFVMLTMLVGNDFMRHLPGFHLGEGMLERLVEMYCKSRAKIGGYLHDAGKLDLKVFQKFLGEMKVLDVEYYERENSGMGMEGGLKIEEEMEMIIDQVEKFCLTINKEGNKEKTQELLLGPRNSGIAYEMVVKIGRELGLDVQEDIRMSGEAGVYEDSDESDDDFMGGGGAGAGLIRVTNMRRGDLFETQKRGVYEMNGKAISETMKKYRREIQRSVMEEEERIAKWKAEYYEQKMGIRDNDGVKKVVEEYVKVLMWVLQYYYQGVPSWRYYYCYHYSPMVSDLEKYGVEQFEKITFKRDEPYKPLEQLMVVLPAGSSSLVPRPLQWLMLDKESPVVDLYPEEFSTDLNGKRNDWEAVVLLEFVDMERIIRAMKSQLSKLDAKEKQRNQRGKAYLFSYKFMKDSAGMASTLPGILPNLRNVDCEVIEYEVPSWLPREKLKRGLTKGTRTGIGMLPGFPTLQSIAHSIDKGNHGVTVFGYSAKGMTVMVRVIEPGYSSDDIEQTIGRLLYTEGDGQVFVGYPYLRQAKVVGVSTVHGLYIRGKGHNAVDFRPFTAPNAHSKWQKRADSISYKLRAKQAISASTQILVHVLPFEKMVLTEDGSLLRTYGQAGHATQLHDPNLCHEWAFTHPFALVLTRPAIQARFASVRSQFKGAEKLMLPEWAEDPRYKEKYLPNAQEEFSSMDHAYFLSRPFYGGHFLVHEVNAHNNTISGALGVPKDYAVYNTVARLGHKALQPPPHPHHAYNPDDDDTAYYPSFVIGRRFGVSSLTISRLASSMIFDNPYFKTKSDRSSFVLGLSLKVDAKNLRVPGYTFKNENGWAYSRKAVGLFEQYFHSFKPDLLILDKLFTSKSSNSTRTFTTLENLVDAGLTLKRLGQISTFVSKLLVSNSVPSLESANNQYFTDSQLRWLQTSPSLKSNHRRRNDPNSPTASSKPPTNIPYYVIKKRNVRCQAVLKPSDNRLRLTNQVFDLGDYVKLINNEGLLLPPGVCGYVVGLNYDMGSAKIFWDTAMYNYVGGSKKNDNDKLIGLSDLLDIDFVCLLNLSNRQYFVE